MPTNASMICKKRVFSITEADDLEDRAALRPVIEALVTQTARFIDRMQEEKRARSLLDYNDLEQLSLSLLVQETPDGYEKNRYGVGTFQTVR